MELKFKENHTVSGVGLQLISDCTAEQRHCFVATHTLSECSDFPELDIFSYDVPSKAYSLNKNEDEFRRVHVNHTHVSGRADLVALCQAIQAVLGSHLTSDWESVNAK